MHLHATDCERLDFDDILREVRADARRHFATPWPNKRDRAEYIASLLADDPGPHGSGYASAPTGFGGRRWHFTCPTCRCRVQYLYRPIGVESFACRRCAGIVQTRRDRGWRWGATLWPTVWELEAFKGRPGRRPRRYHRAVRHGWALVTAARLILGWAQGDPQAPGDSQVSTNQVENVHAFESAPLGA